MIVCNALTFIAICTQLHRISAMMSTLLAFAVMSILTFPIAGIVADTCVGKLKLIQASIVLLIVSPLFNMLLTFVQHYLPTAAETVFVMCTAGLTCIGASCYVACVFPFSADQLIGASGEQLSFAIYWLTWGLFIAIYLIPLNAISSDYIDFAVEAGSFLFISVMAFIFSYCKHLFIILPQQFNPYKLIFNVLNYARKHKYPERCSALTYWEEDVPSRIDLGMSKYGGPFTVEEVEDVKTFLRLLPVIICAGGYNTGCLTDSWYKLITDTCLLTNLKFEIISCYLIGWMVFTVGIPIYHFLLYPLFHNYIPTMLNRIRFGLVLLFSTQCIYAFVGDLLVCNTLANTTCLLFRSELFNMSSSGVWWIAVPVTAYHVEFFVSAIALFEFVCAQSPRPLCGLLSGLIIMSLGLSAAVGYGIHVVTTIIFF